ncbi:hypothetical protein LMG10661_01693 [Ralstonia syzygii subsp. syzygii]|nr:hypothetical protein LMG10661_01693 [Ralstonia syzygii subsp. syzygii]
MNEQEQQIKEIQKAAFQEACGEPLAWTHELEVLAAGYSIVLSNVPHDDQLNPLEVRQMVSGVIALVLFARNVGWISAKAFDQAAAYATELRRRAENKWSGKVVVVKTHISSAPHAAATAATH